jgi:Protein phosphatase 2C
MSSEPTITGLNVRTWRPIVVDRPTVEFEPKAPPSLRYRPDVVCDGWSSAHVTVRLASVRGSGHRYSGTARQDAVDVRLHEPTGVVVFAIADGVSSAQHSDL